jgi:hypothetical protein
MGEVATMVKDLKWQGSQPRVEGWLRVVSVGLVDAGR